MKDYVQAKSRICISLLLAVTVAGSALMANTSADGSPIPDKNGVMMYDYGGSVGVVYNPKVVAQHGLKYHEKYQLTGDLQARQHFLNTADWLVSCAVDKGGYSLWEYDFYWRSYGGIDAPYSSALAQAQGVSVLAKAYNMTGDLRYLGEAKKAFGAFMVDYEDGGVASDEGRDSIFLQILAKPGFGKTYVLNGHTNSLLFIWQYYQYTHDYRALIVFGKGVNWLTGNLQKYDTGSWSYYDSRGTMARDNYHHGHIVQLAKLYDITSEPVLKYYSDRFAAYSGQGL